jgi:hypothetical protein
VCDFLLAATTPQGLVGLRAALPADVLCQPFENASVRRRSPADWALVALTDGYCSCRLYSAPDDEADRRRRQAKLERKYAKRGWSAERIQRAMEQQSAHRRDDSPAGLRPDLSTALAKAAALQPLQFLVQWFRGSIDEELDGKELQLITVGELTASNFPILRDVRYRVVHRTPEGFCSG